MVYVCGKGYTCISFYVDGDVKIIIKVKCSTLVANDNSVPFMFFTNYNMNDVRT